MYFGVDRSRADSPTGEPVDRVEIQANRSFDGVRNGRGGLDYPGSDSPVPGYNGSSFYGAPGNETGTHQLPSVVLCRVDRILHRVFSHSFHSANLFS
jgi:hypothetical protein